MRLIYLLLLGVISTSPLHAASICYLYDGPSYWTCLREERADDQKLEDLREQIHQDDEQEDDE